MPRKTPSRERVTPWNKRITWIVNTYYDSVWRTASTSLGFSHNTIKSNMTSASMEVLVAIANRHPEISLEWLVLGRGPRTVPRSDDPRKEPAEALRDRLEKLRGEIEEEYGLSPSIPTEGGETEEGLAHDFREQKDAETA